VLLQDAQNLQAVALAPWLVLPALPLIVTVTPRTQATTCN
jgi:hypothetical protein